jgi:L-amino acid N-acyltransferase YncA
LPLRRRSGTESFAKAEKEVREMEESGVRIRTAAPEDAAELLRIYAPYVEKTVITFEYEVPSLSEFRGRLERTLPRFPYLAAVRDGEILGYAYTGAFVGRSAYDWSAETTIYLRQDQRKQGLGRRLYQALEDVSRAQHILNLNACIGYPETEDEYLTRNSAQFHLHLGYSPVGEFHNCGYKFGRWYHMIWMEKMIGEHTAHPLPVIPFSRLDPEALAALGIEA